MGNIPHFTPPRKGEQGRPASEHSSRPVPDRRPFIPPSRTRAADR